MSRSAYLKTRLEAAKADYERSRLEREVRMEFYRLLKKKRLVQNRPVNSMTEQDIDLLLKVRDQV